MVSIGCKPGPTEHVKLVPLTLPTGWVVIEDKGQGISVAIPPSWKAGTGTASDLSSMMNNGVDPSTAGQVDPNSALGQIQGSMEGSAKLDEAKEAARLAAKGIYLSATDGSRGTIGETRTSLDLKKVAHDGSYSMEDAVADEKDSLRGLGAGDPKPIKLPIGNAVKFNAEATTRGGDKVNHIHYVVVDGKNVYVLRFRSTNNPQAIQSVADDVVNTLRIVPGK